MKLSRVHVPDFMNAIKQSILLKGYTFNCMHSLAVVKPTLDFTQQLAESKKAC